MELDDILDALRIAEGDNLGPAIEAAIHSAAEDGADMFNLHENAVIRFNDLRAQIEEGGTLSEDQLSAMEVLADVVEGLRTYNASVEQAAAAARDRLDALAARVAGPAALAVEDEEEDQGPDDGGAALDTEATPGADPAARVAAAVEAAVVTPEAGDPAAPVVAAATPSARRPSASIPLGLMPSRSRGPAPAGGRRSGGFQSIDERGTRFTVSAADVPGFSSRQAITSMDQLANVVRARMSTLIRTGVSGQAPVATITRHTSSRLTIDGDTDLHNAVEYATNELNLKGGSLVAAAGGVDGMPRPGWCVPMETIFDLCPDEEGEDGFLDLPTVTTTRAGIRYPANFDFTALWGGAGNFHQAVGGIETPPLVPPGTNVGNLSASPPDRKCCIETPCPSWVDCETEIQGLCIRNSILLEKTWPQWVAQFTAKVLKAHRRKLNAWTIAKVEALAGAKQTFALSAIGTPPNTTTGTHGPGATESVLSILELIVENQRYRYRLGRNRTMEAILPFWALGLLRADLSKKLGNSPDRIDVTDGMIISYLRSRGVVPQFVYDWQDAFSNSAARLWCAPGSSGVPAPLTPTQIADGFGNPAGIKEWPSTLKILVYPAGSVFKLQQSIFTIDSVFDHDSLMQNKYTALMTEEGVNVCTKCYQPQLIEITGLCPSGLSGGIGYSTCAPAVPVEPEPEPFAALPASASASTAKK